jgi:hypothetical protein
MRVELGPEGWLSACRVDPCSTLACWRAEHRTFCPRESFVIHRKAHDTQFTRRESKMAGRILPVALAAMVGVSIGVATFDGEFKKQKMARLEEEYKRYVERWFAFTFIH